MLHFIDLVADMKLNCQQWVDKANLGNVAIINNMDHISS